MTDKEALDAQIKAMIQKARRALESAQTLLDDEDNEGASSKAYYAAFHMAQAALLNKGFTYSKHSGVLAGFSQHLVRSGLFPEKIAADIRHLRRDREVGDYSYTQVVSREEALKDIALASEIVSVIEKHLSSNPS